MLRHFAPVVLTSLLTWVLAGLAMADDTPAAKRLGADAIVAERFIYDDPVMPECHASTIVETPQGLVAAWFGGEREGHRDVRIWLSHWADDGWSKPVVVADGVREGTRFPCWNPVLVSEGERLTLYFKVGPSPSRWWGERIVSTDGGHKWSEPERLKEGWLGPVKNKPLHLDDGKLLCGSSTEHDGWRLHFEIYTPEGEPLKLVTPDDQLEGPQAIQPGLLRLKDETIVALCRPRVPGAIVETRSRDRGETWSKPISGKLPNPGSGIDAVTLADGRHLLVYNHIIAGRSPLNIAVASDDKLAWQAAVALENTPGEYSYPAVIQTSDGLVHVTYTWKRTRVRHVVIDPAKLKPADFDEGRWPRD
jgi:predicted neuraminidase